MNDTAYWFEGRISVPEDFDTMYSKEIEEMFKARNKLTLPLYIEPYSYRSASIGSSRAAFIAGIMPLTVPTITRITVATMTLFGEMIR